MAYADRRARMRPKPFPLEPLADALGIRLEQPDGAAAYGGENLTGTLAAMLEVGPRTAKRLRRDGMSLATADRYATRFGIHPMQLWPAEWGIDRRDPEAAPAPGWWRS